LNQASSAKTKKEKERALLLIDKLEKEMAAQTAHVQSTVERLKKEKNAWFTR
jgi:hypothetical protein